MDVSSWTLAVGLEIGSGEHLSSKVVSVQTYIDAEIRPGNVESAVERPFEIEEEEKEPGKDHRKPQLRTHLLFPSIGGEYAD
jgi:hypothetical protein